MEVSQPAYRDDLVGETVAFTKRKCSPLDETEIGHNVSKMRHVTIV